MLAAVVVYVITRNGNVTSSERGRHWRLGLERGKRRLGLTRPSPRSHPATRAPPGPTPVVVAAVVVIVAAVVVVVVVVVIVVVVDQHQQQLAVQTS